MYTRRTNTSHPISNYHLAKKLEAEEKNGLFARKLQRRYNRHPPTRRTNLQTRQQMAAKKRQELTNLALALRVQTRVNREQRKGALSRKSKPLNKHKSQIEQNYILAKKLEKEPDINPRFRDLTNGSTTRTKPSYETTLHI